MADLFALQRICKLRADAVHRYLGKRRGNILLYRVGKLASVCQLQLLSQLVDVIDNGCLESAEGKLECTVVHSGGGEFYILIFLASESRSGKLVHCGASGIRQTHNSSDLVECLSASVVACTADLLEGIVRYLIEGRMTAGNDKRKIVPRNVGILKVCRGGMRLDVVYGNYRYSKGACKRFCIADAYKKGSDKSGSKRNCDRTYVGEAFASLSHGTAHYL